MLALGFAVPPAGAEDELSRCDPDTAARLRFIEHRLEERRGWATWWWRSWTSFYALGIVVQSTRAGLEDDGGERADFVVGAVKATIGTTTLLLRPPQAREGADEPRRIEPVDLASCRKRLAVAERVLRRNAADAGRRWSWMRHGSNVLLNVAGGAIVAEGFDESDGWTSAGIGVAVGTLNAFSFPWQADDDLAAYERRFAAAGTRPRWTVSAFGYGARVTLHF